MGVLERRWQSVCLMDNLNDNENTEKRKPALFIFSRINVMVLLFIYLLNYSFIRLFVLDDFDFLLNGMAGISVPCSKTKNANPHAMTLRIGGDKRYHHHLAHRIQNNPMISCISRCKISILPKSHQF